MEDRKGKVIIKRENSMRRKNISEKIAIFSGDISRGGGTERVAAFLANSLSERMDTPVSIVSLTESSLHPRFEIRPEVKRFSLSSKWIQPGLGYLPVIFRLYRLIKREGFTVIIDVDNVLDLLSIPCRIFTKIKVISWEQFHFHQTLGTRYRSFCRRFSCLFADHIVTLTQRDADTYKKCGNPRCPVTSIPNAANLLEDPISDCQKEKIVISFGNLVEIKGFDLLIEVAHLLASQFPDWKFYIYGEGEKRQELERLVKKHHLENHVFFHGFCDHIADELKKASIFLMTSRSEGMPMALLEAKYFKLPSVSFDIANGPAEIILDQINGFLIPPFEVEQMAEKLAELMGNSDLRETFSNHAWDNIGKFDKEEIIQKWIKLIQNI